MNKKSNLPKLIVIVGPTASGKSNLAIKIAKHFNGEIVSADSRQIYKGMDIGTAKPPKDNLKLKNQKSKLQFKIKNYIISSGIKHYLIDIKNINEEYSVADYKHDAVKTIKKIISKGKLPILIGGTGLYIKAVTENLNIPKVKENSELRKAIEKEIEKKGLTYVANKLIDLDPESTYIVDLKNPRRVIRALEIAIQTGKPFTAQRKKGKSLFNTIEIGIDIPKEKLQNKINNRVESMIKSGLQKEVKNLYKKYGNNKILTGTIGYKEIIDSMENKISIKDATELIKKNTRNYAKRQMTWFKKNKKTIWVKKSKDAENIVRSALGL